MKQNRPAETLQFPRTGVHWKNQQHRARLAGTTMARRSLAPPGGETIPLLDWAAIARQFMSLPALVVERECNRLSVLAIRRHLDGKQQRRAAA